MQNIGRKEVVRINLNKSSPEVGIRYGVLIVSDAPRKTNMSPENQWLEDVFPIQTVPF